MVDLVTTLGAAAGTYASQDKLNVEDVFSTYVYDGTGADGFVIDNGINLSEHGGLTWIKNRSVAGDHELYDTVRKQPDTNWSPLYADNSGFYVLDLIWDGTYYFAATTSGRVLRSTDAKDWTEYFTGYGGDIQAIASDGNGNVVATVTTTQGAVNVSTDYGVNWTKYTSVISNLDWVYAVAYDPVNSLFVAGGQNGFKVASPSNLSSWSSPSSPPPLNGSTNDLLRLQWDSANNRMWALTALNAANGGGLYYSTDGWNTRTAATLPGGNATTWFWVNEAGHIGAVDSNYSFYVSTDSGSNWTLLSNGWGYGVINDRIGRLTYDETNSRWVVPNGYWNAGSIQAPSSNIQQVSYWNGTTWVNEDYTYGSLVGDNAASINYANGTVFIGSSQPTRTFYTNNPELNSGNNRLRIDANDQNAYANSVKFYNTNGFTLSDWSGANPQNDRCVSWTFRKAPKFFDIVTYTGDNNYVATSDATPQTIQHNLGSIPGMIIIKNMDATAGWKVWHRSVSNTALLNDFLQFDSSNNYDGSIFTVTDTSFNVGPGVSGEITVNRLGNRYVAYIFAHNDGDGEFGITGDQDIIKCGSFTSDGSNDYDIDLGFEPQFLIVKRATGSGDWHIVDNMREFYVDRQDILRANWNYAEGNYVANYIPLSTGFGVRNGVPVGDHIYMAIRRGPMAAPTSATDVFAISSRTPFGTNSPNYLSGFVTDMQLRKYADQVSDFENFARLRGGNWLVHNAQTNETSGSQADWSYMNGRHNPGFGTSTFDVDDIAFSWKRAPGYFDVVTYKGTGAYQLVNHNLGVVPEMIWVKGRDNINDWIVYHKDLNVDGDGRPETDYLILNDVNEGQDAAFWNDVAPTSTQFAVSGGAAVGTLNDNYIAYLFASLPGISKLGSYTGNGSQAGDSQVIDCGFTTGARFVLIKRVNLVDDWHIFNTLRGINSGAEPTLRLNDTASESTDDYIDPNPSGFEIVYSNSSGVNNSGDKYIFYAIA